MSDYRRWISYIYAYENGVKKKSAGYAKLELKDGKLTMTLHITPDGREGSLQVCMYKCHAESREGVLFGSVEKRQGGEGMQFIEDAADLRGSGLLFQEMNGLLLYDDKGKYLISSWENEPIEIAALQEIVARLEQTRLAQKNQRKEVREGEKENKNIVGEDETKNVKIRVNLEDTRENKEIQEVVQEKPSEEIMKDEGKGAINITEETAESMERETFTDKSMEEDKAESSKVKDSETKGEKAENEISAKESEENENLQTQPQFVHTASVLSEKAEQIEKNTVLSPGKLETRLFACLPAMYPFEHQEFERSVRMEPQDIGLLPREMWKYAGNSFLLHSYYAYHHILFVRKMRKEQKNCYLMLPGVYNPKEQHMAQLFGFLHFCPVRKKALQQGDFGYWYMEVEFPGDTPDAN